LKEIVVLYVNSINFHLFKSDMHYRQCCAYACVCNVLVNCDHIVQQKLNIGTWLYTLVSWLLACISWSRS